MRELVIVNVLIVLENLLLLNDFLMNLYKSYSFWLLYYPSKLQFSVQVLYIKRRKSVALLRLALVLVYLRRNLIFLLSNSTSIADAKLNTSLRDVQWVRDWGHMETKSMEVYIYFIGDFYQYSP